MQAALLEALDWDWYLSQNSPIFTLTEREKIPSDHGILKSYVKAITMLDMIYLYYYLRGISYLDFSIFLVQKCLHTPMFK